MAARGLARAQASVGRRSGITTGAGRELMIVIAIRSRLNQKYLPVPTRRARCSGEGSARGRGSRNAALAGWAFTMKRSSNGAVAFTSVKHPLTRAMSGEGSSPHADHTTPQLAQHGQHEFPARTSIPQ
jgi:hypothetical protein